MAISDTIAWKSLFVEAAAIVLSKLFALREKGSTPFSPCPRIKSVPPLFVVVIVAAVFSASARAEIYRCTDADGSAIYTQTPCVSAPPTAVDATASDDRSPGSETLDDTEADLIAYEALPASEKAFEIRAMPGAEQSSMTRSSNEVFACKKPIRDQIDVIDVKMRNGYTAEQGKIYLQELRALTQELRKCE